MPKSTKQHQQITEAKEREQSEDEKKRNAKEPEPTHAPLVTAKVLTAGGRPSRGGNPKTPPAKQENDWT